MTLIIIISATLALMLLHMWLSRRSTAKMARARIELSGEDSNWQDERGVGLTAPRVPRGGVTFQSEEEDQEEEESQPDSEPESEENWKDEPDFEVELAKPPAPPRQSTTQPEREFEELELEPEPLYIPKPVRQPEPEPQPEPQRSFDAEMVSRRQPQAEPQFEPQSIARPLVPETISQPQPEPRREPEFKPEPEPESELERDLEAELELELQPKPAPRLVEPPAPVTIAKTPSEESQAETPARRDVVERVQPAPEPIAAPKPATPPPATMAEPTGPRLSAETDKPGDEPVKPLTLDELAGTLQQIPALPQSAQQILNELEFTVGSARIVGDLLLSDPTVGAALVRVVNSAALGVARRIPTVQEAVSYLGFAAVRGIILRLNLAALFPPPKGARKQCYDTSALWVHATAVSAVADVLAKRVGQSPDLRVDPALASTLGLLHDIGKLAMNSQLPGRVAELRPQKKARKTAPAANALAAYENMLARERRIFGADHAVIGGLLAQRWQLPGELADAIRLHHLPAGETLDHLPPPFRRAVILVHIANQLVKLKHTYCEDMPFDVIPESLFISLNLPPSLDALLDQSVCTAIAHATAISHELDVVPKQRKRLSA
jgi:putative nucleotidyltransferase with HDIG domain